jgi:hypothetical protein
MYPTLLVEKSCQMLISSRAVVVDEATQTLLRNPKQALDVFNSK